MNDTADGNTISLLDESTLSRYISNKIYLAKSMTRDEYRKLRGFEMSAEEDEPGYVILYPDGYISWSPAKQFEETSTRTDGMNFGMALVALKKDFKVARKNWNGILAGNTMYVALVEASSIKPEDARSGAALCLAEEGFNNIDIMSHIDMRAADGSVQIGWAATQSDMLSNDWFIVD